MDLFGVGGLLDLLASGALEITSSVRCIGLPTATQPGVPCKHPNLHFVSLLQDNAPKVAFNHNIAESLKRISLQTRERIRLDRAIRDVLQFERPKSGGDIGRQLERDLLHVTDEVRMAVTMALRRRFDINIGVDDFDLEFQLTENGAYRHITSIGHSFNLSMHQLHEVLGDAILAIGGMEARIQKMKDLQAIAGFTGEDLPLFESKLNMFYTANLPEIREQSFHRILDLVGIPIIPAGTRDIHVDVGRLLKVRESAEHREFIAWLARADTMTDKEIRDAFASFGARMSTLVYGPRGEVSRFLFNSAIGAIPGVGTVMGTALGAIDTFLLKRLIPYSGPAAFVNRQYPSLFKT